ncbi:MAG TPA: alkaline phosphatase family protein [Bryobacteraceae bacterium]|nr:alkaline phosphatase family protein [Bryobacteraceae bacterium]
MRSSALARAMVVLLCGLPLPGAVQRIVILKVDGVPAEVLESELQRENPITHKSALPWIDHVFRQGGTSVPNFYVRAISLSAPSWSMLDTGRHLEIRGNAEFDRYTGHAYDYLNFFPFYVEYALSHKVDMPGVEVLDDLKIPLLIDRFPYAAVYQGPQLYQRGVRWKSLQHGLTNRFSRPLRELLDEWAIGFEMGSSIEEQTERELIEKLADPGVRYLDYFTGDYDHVAHSTPDRAAQRLAMQRMDALVGRIWTAIEASSLGPTTALVLLSDHGMNTEPGVFSQGYDLVRFFNSQAGGAHHVMTNRHPMTEYKLKGLDPFVSEVITPSVESRYLKNQANDYPSVILDLDGNERTAVYMRNSVWNVLQILLQQIDRSELQPAARHAAIGAFFRVVQSHRDQWEKTVRQLRWELEALHQAIEQERARVQAAPAKWTALQREAGLDKAARRLSVDVESWREQERTYSEYAEALSRLLDLKPADLQKRRISAEAFIPKHAMGDPNDIYDLQNYIVGPSAGGLVLAEDGSLDFARSFERIDYFPLLASLSVRNNVQAQVGSHPVDYIAMRIDSGALPREYAAQQAIWLYHDQDRQALILSRHDAGGVLELRYVPVRTLRQDAQGAIHFEPAVWAAGFPLHLWEDPNLAVAASERSEWLAAWHSELDWMHAVHRTEYSNGIIALDEQFSRVGESAGADGMEAFRRHKRELAEPDFLIFAADHWNFNVRGFNPGGNHGSFRRISTRSVLLFAGGEEAGIPRHREIEEPYDSLSLVPTILELMGKNKDARELPGRPIRELFTAAIKPSAKR